MARSRSRVSDQAAVQDLGHQVVGHPEQVFVRCCAFSGTRHDDSALETRVDL